MTAATSRFPPPLPPPPPTPAAAAAVNLGFRVYPLMLNPKLAAAAAAASRFPAAAAVGLAVCWCLLHPGATVQVANPLRHITCHIGGHCAVCHNIQHQAQEGHQNSKSSSSNS